MWRLPVVWLVLLAFMFDLPIAEARRGRRGARKNQNRVVAAPFPGAAGGQLQRQSRGRGRVQRGRGRGRRRNFGFNRRFNQPFFLGQNAIFNPALFQGFAGQGFPGQVFPGGAGVIGQGFPVPTPTPAAVATGPVRPAGPTAPVTTEHRPTPPFADQQIPPTRPESPGAPHCTDLHASVCGRTQDARVFEQEMERRNTELLDQFAPRQPGGVDAFVKMMGEIAQSPGQAASKHRVQYSKYLEFLNGSLRTKVPDLDQTLETIAQSLTSAISKNPDLSGQVSDSRSISFTKNRFITAPDLNNPALVAAFVEVCGPDGLIPNAAYEGTLGVVIICPGIILSSKAGSGSTLSGLAHVCAHELGHSIDNLRRPGYAAIRACYASLKPQDIAGVPLPNVNNRETMAEIIADEYAGQATAEILQNQNLKGDRALDFIKSSAKILCASSGERHAGESGGAPHPDARFRINFILGRNPAIRDALGCARPTDETPACTIKGRIP